MRNEGFKSNLFCLFLFLWHHWYGDMGYFLQLHAAWSMNLRHLQHTLDPAKLAFSAYQFWQESFLNISNHLLKSWPEAHLHISRSYLVNPLIFADSCPGWHNYSLWGLIFQFHGQFGLKFHWVKMCFSIAPFDTSDIQITFKLLLLTMSL